MPFVFVVFFNSFSCARVGSAQNDQLSPLDEAWMSFKSYKLGSSQPSMDVVVATRRLFRAFYVGWIIIDYIPRAATQQVNTFAYWRAIFAQLEEKCQSEHWVVFNSRPTLKFQHVKNRLCFLLFLLRFSNIHWTFSDFSRVQLGTVNEREETLSRKKNTSKLGESPRISVFWLWSKVQIYLLFCEIFTANLLDALAECLVAAEELRPSRRWAHIQQPKQNNEYDGKNCQKGCRHFFRVTFHRSHNNRELKHTEQLRQSKKN